MRFDIGTGNRYKIIGIVYFFVGVSKPKFRRFNDFSFTHKRFDILSEKFFVDQKYIKLKLFALINKSKTPICCV